MRILIRDSAHSLPLILGGIALIHSHSDPRKCYGIHESGSTILPPGKDIAMQLLAWEGRM